MAIFGNKNKNGNFTINFCSVENTPIYDPINFAITVTLLDDKIEFKQRLGGKNKVYLKYLQITRVGVIDGNEIIEKDKSVLGRAIVGGLLLGSLGSVVGAIDGVGTKKKVISKKKYLVFNYISSDNKEKSLPVEIVGATLGLSKFLEKLNEICPNLENDFGTYL